VTSALAVYERTLKPTIERQQAAAPDRPLVCPDERMARVDAKRGDARVGVATSRGRVVPTHGRGERLSTADPAGRSAQGVLELVAESLRPADFEDGRIAGL
jgi:hypothetical protein